MRAKITKPQGYSCAPQGAIVMHFPYGAEVDGRAAEMALQDHAAARMFDREIKVDGPPETKAKRPGRPRK